MSGLTMMLLTCTWSPPSCAAMLPQKFSAAETGSLPLDGPVEELADPPQPAIITPITASTPHDHLGINASVQQWARQELKVAETVTQE